MPHLAGGVLAEEIARPTARLALVAMMMIKRNMYIHDHWNHGSAHLGSGAGDWDCKYLVDSNQDTI